MVGVAQHPESFVAMLGTIFFIIHYQLRLKAGRHLVAWPENDIPRLENKCKYAW